jgi:DNA-binding HxlR family transcriptional regulator
MAALDLLGRRWALRVLWELQAEPLGARALLSRCEGLSPSVLYDRLRELTEAGLIGRQGEAYALTRLGRGLGDAIAPLDSWSRRWAREVG